MLILTASTGAGHLSAAKAVQEAAASAGWITESIDCMDHTSAFFRNWFRGGYETLVRRWPALWGYLYRIADKPSLSFAIQTCMDWAFMSRLDRIVAEFRPDWVVCTHSVPQPRLHTLRKRFSFLTAIVVTDLYPHRMWLRGRPDLMLLPTEWSLSALRKRVGTGWIAKVTGIPIASGFGSQGVRQTDRTRDTSRFRIIVSMGGIGGGPVAAAVRALSELPIAVDIEVLCGWNRSLLKQVSEIPCYGPAKLFPLDAIPNEEMPDKMQRADLLIGKSGGLTASEALASGLPFVVFDPCLIPGQEERNADFLVEVGAGVRAATPQALVDCARLLLDSPSRRSEMRKNAIALAKPNAARDVVRELESFEP